MSISGGAAPSLARLITINPQFAAWAIQHLLPLLQQGAGVAFAAQDDIAGSPFDTTQLHSAAHDRYLRWVRPGAKGRAVKMPWSGDRGGSGNRVLDDYDESTATGFEANTRWSKVPADDLWSEVSRKMKEAADDFTILVDGLKTIKNSDPINRIVWFGPEPLPTSGPFAELAEFFAKMKRAGIPLEYQVVPGPP